MEKDILKDNFRVVMVGGSAGSLEVITKMLSELINTKLAMVLIIHRKGSIHSSLADVLNLKTALVVKEAEEKEIIRPGFVYIAPADYHLLIERDGSLSLDYSEKINFSRPSIDVSFECAADVFGARVIGILLSGGNADGVAGLKSIRRAGGKCVVQDPGSALVSYMPMHALAELKPDKTLNSAEMADYLNGIP
jgi:two-component system, chemotaxis family, protein-glutamate methylesterase/glutaminase